MHPLILRPFMIILFLIILAFIWQMYNIILILLDLFLHLNDSFIFSRNFSLKALTLLAWCVKLQLEIICFCYWVTFFHAWSRCLFSTFLLDVINFLFFVTTPTFHIILNMKYSLLILFLTLGAFSNCKSAKEEYISLIEETCLEIG